MPKKKTAIKKVIAREILDSRGMPTVEAEVHLEGGAKAWSQVPSGASTGAFEAHELRDGDAHRYFGKGVLGAVENINGEINDLVVGKDASDQKTLDQMMIDADGTVDKGRLGANAILAVSLAACRASATAKGMPLYAYIAQLHGTTKPTLPMPMFNIINGGKHADSGLAIQEYKMIPHGIATFTEQYRAGAEIFHALKKNLEDEGMVVAVGDEGGFAPHLNSNEAPLDEIARAAEAAGYRMGTDISIGIDAAANTFYNDQCDRYVFEIEKVAHTAEDLTNIYRQWISEKYLVSVEDGLIEDDWDGWAEMNRQIGKDVMLIGDDLIVTNVGRLQQAIDNGSCNSVLIKPNQIGSLSETLACIALAQKHDMRIVVSHRSGETIDDFIADLSVGVAAEYIKTGSLSRGERLAKYNRLQAIEEQLSA